MSRLTHAAVAAIAILAAAPAIADDAGGVDTEEQVAALVQHDTREPAASPAATAPIRRPAPRPEGLAERAAVPPAPASLKGASARQCIAVAIYHEARDQDDDGQRAVASVILQRAAVEHRWGDTPCEVVVPVQFSFMTSRYGYAPINEPDAWAKAWRLAREVMQSGPLPELSGADHYHTAAVAPYWAPKMVRIAQIGSHVFYTDPASG